MPVSRPLCLCFLVVAALTGGVARAQTPTAPAAKTPAMKPAAKAVTVSSLGNPGLGRLGIHLGGFKATGGRNFADDQNNWAIFGLTYRLQAAGKRTFLQPDLYMDFARTYSFGSGYSSADTSTLPLVNVPASVASVGSGRGFWGIGVSTRGMAYMGRGQFAAFAGAGAGIYRVETFQSVYVSNTYGDVISTSDLHQHYTFRPGGKLFAGLSHRSGLYAEASLHDVGTVDTRSLRGLSVAFGYRH